MPTASRLRRAAARRPDSRAFVLELAGGVASYTGPDSPFNKLAGLGFGDAVDEEGLADVERTFAERGAAVQAEVASLADPSVSALLTGRGYVLRNFENVLGLRLPPRGPAGRRGPHRRLGRRRDAARCLARRHRRRLRQPRRAGRPVARKVLARRARPDRRRLATASGFARYLAHRNGVLTGGASLRICEGVAQLCGGATAPAHRRRGVQGALLAARLADGARQGCDVAVVITQPGSKSQQNVQRQGFELLYTRAILVRP